MSLEKAVQAGDLEAVERLLTAGTPVDLIETAPPRWTPLMSAAVLGEHEIAARLLGAGAALNVEDLDGFTAVTLAARNKHWDIVELLAKQGADFGISGGDGRTGVDLLLRLRKATVRDRILASLDARLMSLERVPQPAGDCLTGIVCGQCGQPTIACRYSWSGFGDSYDNFEHTCENPACRTTRARLGIVGRLPRERPEDATRCPFCARRGL
jgi:ankyrin repeat protein